MKTVTITGTKGKTTVSRILGQIFSEMGLKTLQTDTQHVAVNGQIVPEITPYRSMKSDRLGLAVKPGRFLSILPEADVAVFEASIGCKNAGLGYKSHDIGVFLNVFTDHLSRRDGRLTQEDIANDKSFVFSKISKGGIAVFNADDVNIAKVLDKIPQNVTKFPFGLAISHGITVENGTIVYKNSITRKIADLKDIKWTFDGQFEPSIYNALAVTSVLIAYGLTVEQAGKALIKSSLSEAGGRLVKLEGNDRTVICDYAHEEESLVSLADLAKKLNENETIGVVRLAPRPRSQITKVAKAIYDKFDHIIVYQKYDGELHRPTAERLIRNNETTQYFYDRLKEFGADVEIVKREDEAINKAIKTSQKGDVIVHIVHDKHEKSVELAKKALGELV